MTKERFEIVSIKKVGPSSTNPRRSFNEAEILELAESIIQVGIINPITVVESKNGYEIVSGERRWRAAVRAELKEIPVIIRDLTAEEILEIQIIENLQRKDVHPLDEAHGFKSLLDSHKYDNNSIADRVGKSEKYVYQRLKLLDLIEPIQKSFYEEEIILAHALLLCKLQPADQERAFRYLVYDYNGKKLTKENINSPRSLSHWIELNVFMDLNKICFRKDDTKLCPSAGACIDCSKRTGFNKSLFSDMNLKDSCTDPTCFNSKIAAFIEQKKAKLDQKKEKYVLITTEYSPKDNDVIGYRDYNRVSKDGRCESMQKALIVGGDLDERGKVVNICADKTCKVHHGYSRSSKTPEEKQKEREEKKQLQIRETANHQILTDLLDVIPIPYTRKELEILAKYVFMHCAHDFKIILFKRHLWQPIEKNGYKDYGDALEGLLPKFTDEELFRLFIEISFLNEIKVMEYNRKAGEKLREVAKSYDINIASIERSLQAESNKSKKKKAA